MMLRTLEKCEHALSGACKTAFALAAVAYLPLPVISQAQTAVQAEAFKSCAKSDAYKAFEQEQYNQYLSSPAFQRQLSLLRDQRAVIEGLTKTDQELAKRKNSLRFMKYNNGDDKVSDYIRAQLAKQILPTCYENPLTYFLLSTYAGEIDDARRRLGLPLAKPVNLATLPTEDINAYTYPVLDSTENIVAVNSQLFMFAYQMTKVVFPTIGVRKVGNKVAVDLSPPTDPSAEVLTNFTMALLEFLSEVSPSTRPLDKAYDASLITMVEGIEKFVIAHEYGHVIREHASTIGRFRLGAVTDYARTGVDIPVLMRSWQQELEADETGFHLLAESVRAGASRPTSAERRGYVLRGALLFFRFLAIIEDARDLRDNGHLSIRPTPSEREFVRSYVIGATTADQDRQYANLLKADHPPTWLRAERIAALLDAELAAHPLDPKEEDYSPIAIALDRNADRIWQRVADRFSLALRAARAQRSPDQTARASAETDGPKASFARADCPLPEAFWAGQSICTASLMEAAAAFQAGTASDKQLLLLYGSALEQDWLLFTGAQVGWAQATLVKGENIEFALALIALSGMAEAAPKLDRLDTRSWTSADRKALTKASAFLRAHGRSTRLVDLASLDPARFNREMLIAYPVMQQSLKPAFSQVPARTPELDRFFASNGALEPEGSLAGMMTSSLYLRHVDGVALSLLAELLIDAKRFDLAMAYAESGKARGGLASVLENTIGNVLMAQGRREEAIAHYRLSLAAGRSDGWPEINMAMNFAKLGDNKQAEQWYRAGLGRRATARSPTEYARYLNSFAWFLVSQYSNDKGRVAEALKLSLESNALTDLSDLDYLDTLVEALHASGAVASAIEFAEAIAESTPDLTQREAFRAKAEKFKSTQRR